MKEILQVLNMRIVYEPHWIGLEDGKVVYDHSEIAAQHEIAAYYLPKELYLALRKFVEKAERACDDKED